MQARGARASHTPPFLALGAVEASSAGDAATAAATSHAAEALFPVESFLVALLIWICRPICSVVLFLVEWSLGQWAVKTSSKRLPNNSSGKKSSPTSAPVLPSTKGKDAGEAVKVKAAAAVAAAKVDAACMADMILSGIVPFYYAKESRYAMLSTNSSGTAATLSSCATTPPSSAKPSSSAAFPASNNNASITSDQPTNGSFDSASTSSFVDEEERQRQLKMMALSYRRVFVSGSNSTASYRIVRTPAPPTASTATSSSSSSSSAPAGRPADAIILAVGSTASDQDLQHFNPNPATATQAELDVSRTCVLGQTALLLADQCNVVGSVAVVAATVDFLNRPEPLSDAMDRFELLCTEICTAIPSGARGPLIIVARGVTAMLALHAIVRAARNATPAATPVLGQGSAGGGNGGSNSGTVPSLRHAALIAFNPFVGWNMKSVASNASTTSASAAGAVLASSMRTPSSSFDDVQNAASSTLGSSQATPNAAASAATPPHELGGGADDDGSYNIPTAPPPLPHNASFDENDLFDRFDEASFVPGSTVAAGSAVSANVPTSANAAAAAAAAASKKQNISLLARLLPSSDTVEHLRSAAHTLFTPSLWPVSRVFRLRLRCVGSATWARAQEVAPTVFTPALAGWFPASALTFLYPTVRALVVCDSAAPFSVETVAWARSLVTQGCAVRLVEWSSARRDPYSGFQARVLNEAATWLHDLLVESGITGHHHHHHLHHSDHHGLGNGEFDLSFGRLPGNGGDGAANTRGAKKSSRTSSRVVRFVQQQQQHGAAAAAAAGPCSDDDDDGVVQRVSSVVEGAADDGFDDDGVSSVGAASSRTAQLLQSVPRRSGVVAPSNAAATASARHGNNATVRVLYHAVPPPPRGNGDDDDSASDPAERESTATPDSPRGDVDIGANAVNGRTSGQVPRARDGGGVCRLRRYSESVDNWSLHASEFGGSA